jgi:hypothetical protein
MENRTLQGCTILVVEGDARTAVRMAAALKRAGASATTTTSVGLAHLLVEHNDKLSAAILLGADDRAGLCSLLTTRGIPYVQQRGYGVDELLTAVEGLLADRPRRIG